MQFEFTEEQRLIQSMAADFFRDQGSSEQVRAALELAAGFDAELWQRMAAELGFAGLGIAEAYQGQALGLVESAIVFEQMGRTLLPSPLLGTGVLAASAIAAAGNDAQRQRWLPGIAEGSLTATLAPGLPSDNNGRLTPVGDGFNLAGQWTFVIDASSAGLLLLEAQADDETVLVAVPADRLGLTIERHTSLDLTRPHHTVRAEGVEVRSEEVLRNVQHFRVDEWAGRQKEPHRLDPCLREGRWWERAVSKKPDGSLRDFG